MNPRSADHGTGKIHPPLSIALGYCAIGEIPGISEWSKSVRRIEDFRFGKYSTLRRTGDESSLNGNHCRTDKVTGPHMQRCEFIYNPTTRSQFQRCGEDNEKISFVRARVVAVLCFFFGR